MTGNQQDGAWWQHNGNTPDICEAGGTSLNCSIHHFRRSPRHQWGTTGDFGENGEQEVKSRYQGSTASKTSASKQRNGARPSIRTLCCRLRNASWKVARSAVKVDRIETLGFRS
jgi:hypothetical protein